MSSYRRARLTISKGVLRDNIEAVRRATRGTRLLAVIKADAYGHGLLTAAKVFAPYCYGFAVATIDEAVRLREAGFSLPVLVLGGTPESAAAEAVERHISLAVYDRGMLKALQAEAAKRETVAHCHLKVDTGMSRVGVRPGEELEELISAWKDARACKMEGIFTHFSDSEDEAFTSLQDFRFEAAVARARHEGFRPMAHAAASFPAAQGKYLHDACRPGIALYGCEVRHILPDIRPAQTLTAWPVRIAWIGAGEPVGYGRTFTAQRPTRVMTVPVGYGDGYKRALSGKASALVCGKRAPVIGRVCMDQLMLDVTDVPEADMDSPAVLMGAQGNDRITPEELAQMCDTIPYEIMVSFTDRLTREVVE